MESGGKRIDISDPRWKLINRRVTIDNDPNSKRRIRGNRFKKIFGIK